MNPPMRIGVWELGSAETLRLGRRPASSVKELGASSRGTSRGPRGRHVDTEWPAKARNHSWVAWDWGTPPSFGAVGSGKEACIFLCQGAQGGRGRGANTTTFQQDGDEEGDKGVWMSVWVDDLDEMHKHCIAAGFEITFPPTDMPWNVREMHLRHPDGHVFRVSRGFDPKK